MSAIGQSGKIGWDAGYRTQDKSVLFSGDVTDAPRPNGATELFYLKNCDDEPRIFNINYYNFSKGDDVDCKIIAAQEAPRRDFNNYMVDINKIIAQANIKISRKQTILGLVVNIDGENRVYFANTSIGNSITAHENKVSRDARNYFVAYTSNLLSLRDILEMAGARVTNEHILEGNHIDLSPSSLDRATIINLIMKQKPDNKSTSLI